MFSASFIKESKYPLTMKGFFERYHNPQILVDARRVLQDLYPEYLDSYDSAMAENRYYLKCICIMKKELFDEYIDWEMSILSKLEAYPWCTGNRELAYLAERLMNVFVEERIVKKGIKVKEEPMNRLVEKKELVGYVNKGYWQCMDTLREKQ